MKDDGQEQNNNEQNNHEQNHSHSVNIGQQRYEAYKLLGLAVENGMAMSNTAKEEHENAFIAKLVQSLVEALVYVGDSINSQTQVNVQIFNTQLQMMGQAQAEVPEERSKMWTPR